MSVIETGGLSAVHSSHRTERPDARLLHYNDVYHVEYVDQLHELPIWHLLPTYIQDIKLTLQAWLCRTSRWCLPFPIRRQLLPI